MVPLLLGGCGVAASASPSATKVLRPPVAPDRIPVSVFDAYMNAAQRAIIKAQQTNVDPAAAIGLSPGCRSWLGAQVTDLFCGSLPPHSIEVSGPPELEVSGPGVRGGGMGAITQLTGLPLRPGGILHLRALQHATGALVVESTPRPGVTGFARFDLDLPAGAVAEIRYDPQRGVVMERRNLVQRPVRTATTPELSFPPPPLPNSAGPYQDCRALGGAETITDPTGDVVLNTADIPVADGSYPGLDITQATLARAGGVICLDLDLTSPPAVNDAYDLFLTAPLPHGIEPPGGPVTAKITISLASSSYRVLSTDAFYDLEPIGGYVSVPRGLIGVRGDQLSLMIQQSQLVSQPLPAFDWEVDTVTSASPGVEPYDCAPNYGNALYPPGYRVAPPPPGVGAVRPTRCRL